MGKQEWSQIQAQAQQANMTTSEWIRSKLIKGDIGMRNTYTVKGRTTGKTITIEADYDSFLNQFYGCDEQPVQDDNGAYIVDDETIESTIKEHPEVIDCSLVNYGKDCRNQPLWGGHRDGAGRPPTGRKRRTLYLTDEEEYIVRSFLIGLREEKGSN